MKLSGEALQGKLGFGIDYQVRAAVYVSACQIRILNMPSSEALGHLQVLETVAREVAAAAIKGIQIAIVVGGGNYFRGANAWAGLERASADYVGMLATCMNALQLQVECTSMICLLRPSCACVLAAR